MNLGVSRERITVPLKLSLCGSRERIIEQEGDSTACNDPGGSTRRITKPFEISLTARIKELLEMSQLCGSVEIITVPLEKSVCSGGRSKCCLERV